MIKSHKGIKCNSCERKNIKGERFHCLNCENINICDECYNSKKHTYNHNLIVIKIVGEKWLVLEYNNTLVN